MKVAERNTDGTFMRIIKPFSLENFDDGYVDADGRFRVYMPNHPRADRDGHILRAIVAYEAYHGITVSLGNDIHHKNGNRLDDSQENLDLLNHVEHAHLSNIGRVLNIARTCKNCGINFNIKPYRLRQDGHTGEFCSHKCWEKFNRGKHHINYKKISVACEQCHKVFEFTPHRKLRFCSHSCANKFNWNQRRGSTFA